MGGRGLSVQEVVFAECDFLYNSATGQGEVHGGVLTLEASTASFTRCMFLENVAASSRSTATGGVAYANVGSVAIFTSNVFLRNEAISPLSKGAFGGVLYVLASYFSVSDGRFDGNAASQGAALYYSSQAAVSSNGGGGVSALINVRSSPRLSSYQSHSNPAPTPATPPQLTSTSPNHAPTPPISFSGNHGAETIFFVPPISWSCQAGYWQPMPGQLKGDFVDCMLDASLQPPQACAAGHWGGGFDNHTRPTCAGSCLVGHFCTSATAWPIPCRAGTYMATTGAPSEQSCTSCGSGSFSNTPGSTAWYRDGLEPVACQPHHC